MKILIISDEKFVRKHTPNDIFEKYEVYFAPSRASDDVILSICSDCDVIICDAMAIVSRNVIEHMPSLKLIHSDGVGYQGIDTAAATEKGIFVCNCKGINAVAVAEHAVMLMLALIKDIVNNDRIIREGKMSEVKREYMAKGSLKELNECTIGLVGFGDIGKAISTLLKAFGCTVIYYDVYRQSIENEQKYGVQYMELDTLLAQSDIVSLHLPVFESTRNMANDSFFAKMKQGAYFVNTARGELCDTRALLRRIEGGHISGAGLDCIRGEPVTLDNVILSAKPEVENKIILSPHIAGITNSTFVRGFKILWGNVEKLQEGQDLVNVVNRVK